MSGVPNLKGLPRREREIAELVVAQAEATANQIVRMLPEPLSNSAVRSMLRRLEAKGVLRHRMRGREFVYLPSVSIFRSREAILREIAADYFDGSILALVGHATSMVEEGGTNQPMSRTS